MMKSMRMTLWMSLAPTEGHPTQRRRQRWMTPPAALTEGPTRCSELPTGTTCPRTFRNAKGRSLR